MVFWKISRLQGVDVRDFQRAKGKCLHAFKNELRRRLQQREGAERKLDGNFP